MGVSARFVQRSVAMKGGVSCDMRRRSRRLPGFAEASQSSRVFLYIASVVFLQISCTLCFIVSIEDSWASKREIILLLTSVVSDNFTILVSIDVSIVRDIRSRMS